MAPQYLGGVGKPVLALIRVVMLRYETSLECAISRNFFGPAIARRAFMAGDQISAAPPSMTRDSVHLHSVCDPHAPAASRAPGVGTRYPPATSPLPHRVRLA